MLSHAFSLLFRLCFSLSLLFVSKRRKVYNLPRSVSFLLFFLRVVVFLSFSLFVFSIILLLVTCGCLCWLFHSLKSKRRNVYSLRRQLQKTLRRFVSVVVFLFLYIFLFLSSLSHAFSLFQCMSFVVPRFFSFSLPFISIDNRVQGHEGELSLSLALSSSVCVHGSPAEKEVLVLLCCSCSQAMRMTTCDPTTVH